MTNIFNLILFQPILNLMVLAYNYIPDIGVVIILLTAVIRLLLAPSFHKSLHSQKQMAALQPKLNEMREKYKNDKEAQAREMMKIYQESKVNPFGSCLPLLVQIPLLIALYQVFRTGLGGTDLQQWLYPFVNNPGVIDPLFLNYFNMANPNIYLGVLAGLAQYWQSKMMISMQGPNTDPTARALSIQTLYVLPILTVFISAKLPAGLPLYWITTTLFAVAQQYYIMRANKNT